jgi:hypothetical protein
MKVDCGVMPIVPRCLLRDFSRVRVAYACSRRMRIAQREFAQTARHGVTRATSVKVDRTAVGTSRCPSMRLRILLLGDFLSLLDIFVLTWSACHL